MAAKRSKTAEGFAICIDSDDPDLLTPRMIYQVLPEESAARSGYIRVIDNEGEDYLYPARYFVFVDLPQDVRLVLARSAGRAMRGEGAGRGRSIPSQRGAPHALRPANLPGAEQVARRASEMGPSGARKTGLRDK